MPTIMFDPPIRHLGKRALAESKIKQNQMGADDYVYEVWKQRLIEQDRRNQNVELQALFRRALLK